MISPRTALTSERVITVSEEGLTGKAWFVAECPTYATRFTGRAALRLAVNVRTIERSSGDW